MNEPIQVNLRWGPFFSLFIREIRRFLKVIFQTIATPLISTTLYLLIFGVSIGREIASIQDFSYLAFLIPGLVMMATLRNAFENASGSIVTSKFCGELEDLRMVPLSAVQITWANGLGALVRGLIVGGITLFIGDLFYLWEYQQHLPFEHPWILVIFSILGGLAFAHLGLAVSMFSKTFEEVNAVNTFILLPLIYLGGVFFSLAQLHPFWQTVSKFNPLLYLVNGLRYGLLGIADVNIGFALVVVIFTFLGFHLLAIWSLKKGSYHRW